MNLSSHNDTSTGISAFVNEADWNHIQAILLHMNSISLACSSLIVITFLLFKREFPRSMPLQLGIVTCFLHAGVLMGPILGFDVLNDLESYCYVQACILQYSSVAIGCWLFNIALHLYCTIVKRWTTQKILKLVPYIHIFGWLFPLITTIPPLAAQKMITRNLWCWVSNEAYGVWELACFYIPIMLILGVTSILWIAVIIRVCKISTQFKTVSYSIQSVLIIFFLSLSFGFQCAHRIYNHTGKDSFVLELLHTITLSSIGMVVFFVYGLNYDNVQLYVRLMKKCCSSNSNYTQLATPETIVSPNEGLLVNERMSVNEGM